MTASVRLNRFKHVAQIAPRGIQPAWVAALSGKRWPLGVTVSLLRLGQALRKSAPLVLSVLVGLSPLAAGEIKPAEDAPQPLSPEESARRFRLPPGFRIELVASEPHLADPTDMAFDARGRLFVCELHGYNLEGHYDIQELNKAGVLDKQVRRIAANPEALARATRESHGSVKLLTDTDGDGRMDRMVVWADDLPPCYGVVAARDGVIVLCAPDIVYLADRDGDGRPDVRETLFTGFGVGEMWTRISSPQWGVDNWIYAACGEGSAGTIRGPRLAAPVRLGQTGFRFKSDGSRFEPVSGGTSGFGLAMDDWDERFLVTNQEHALHVAPLPFHYLARNPHYASPRTVNNICTYGHPAQVYPLAPPDPWRLQRSQDPAWVKFYGAAEVNLGLVTAACAPFIYRAGAFPAPYQGAHFSCECAYNLIHLCRLEPDGASFKAVRAFTNSEFLTSTEQWFRPVNLADGPDGALYIVDMYREIIEDYSAIPRYLQQQYGLIQGADRGRIWRVVHEAYSAGQKAAAVKAGPGLATAVVALVNELSSANAWRRLTAQRVLVERGGATAVAALTRLVRDRPTPQSRLHALYTLDGLEALDTESVVLSLSDAHSGVRRHALQLAEAKLDHEPTLLEKVLTLTQDPSPAVRLQLAFTLGETRHPQRLAKLVELANQWGADPWMQAAIVSSVPDSAGELLRQLARRTGLTGQGRSLVRPLASVIGSRQQTAEVAGCLRTIADYRAEPIAAFQTEALTGLAEGLRRAKVAALTESDGLAALGQLLSGEVPAVRRLGLQVAGLLQATRSPEITAQFAQAAADALNADRPLKERQVAIKLLASAPFASLEPTATNLLAASQPLDIQLATITALAATDDPGVGPLLLSGWSRYSPQAQTAVLDALFRRQERIKVLLTAIEQKVIPRPGLDAGRRNQLLTNPDAEIRRRAESMLAGDTTGKDRQPVLARYQAALSGPRDPVKGKEHFRLNCSSCHQLEGVGVVRGPELTAATKGRADETILLDILQPSDQITVGFRTYQVVTVDNAIFNGILTGESATSVTLPDEDGLPQTILRKDIASMQASDVSIMPANFDELLQPQDVADILGYLRQVASAGPGPVLTLFEDDPGFAERLNEGEGTATVETAQPYSGVASLAITPLQRFSPRIAGWDYAIVETPAPGQYRYLRFAWKASAAEGVMLELAADGQWPPPDRALHRYAAGRNTTGWQARALAEQPPRDWTVVTVDLWRDFGAFTLTGLAPTAMGGPAHFDRIQLLRNLEPGESPLGGIVK